MTGEVVHVKSASGVGNRPLVKATLLLGGKKITTTASITDRTKMKYPVIVGRRDLKDFLIKPVLYDTEPDNDTI